MTVSAEHVRKPGDDWPQCNRPRHRQATVCRTNGRSAALPGSKHLFDPTDALSLPRFQTCMRKTLFIAAPSPAIGRPRSVDPTSVLKCFMAAKYIFNPSEALTSPNRQARCWPVPSRQIWRCQITCQAMDGAAVGGLDSALRNLLERAEPWTIGRRSGWMPGWDLSNELLLRKKQTAVLRNKIDNLPITFGPKNVESVRQNSSKSILCSIGPKNKAIVGCALKLLNVTVKAHTQPRPLCMRTQCHPITTFSDRHIKIVPLKKRMKFF